MTKASEIVKSESLSDALSIVSDIWESLLMFSEPIKLVVNSIHLAMISFSQLPTSPIFTLEHIEPRTEYVAKLLLVDCVHECEVLIENSIEWRISLSNWTVK